MKVSIGKRMNLLSIMLMIVMIAAILTDFTYAKPSGILRRQKRVSDQRLAELETLLALARLRGQLVTVPVAFGLVDPAKIGRKRRSTIDSGLGRLHRLLQEAAARGSESIWWKESVDGLLSLWTGEENQRTYRSTNITQINQPDGEE